jgi:SAM-dependent methyltransferase
MPLGACGRRVADQLCRPVFSIFTESQGEACTLRPSQFCGDRSPSGLNGPGHSFVMRLTDRLNQAATDHLRERPRLILRRRDDEAYAEILFRHLGARGPREVGFFVNEKRFYLFAAMVEHHVGSRAGAKMKILNVACGPFALEHYCDLSNAEIVSFDIDTGLIGVYGDLRAAGLIANCHFFIGDAEKRALRERFDLVVINDLFYAKEIDYYAVIDQYARLVKPSGYLYFDILDQRAGPVWAMAGKNAAFNRYDLDPVARHLEALGFTIVAAVPSMGIKGGLDERIRKLLWSSMRVANNAAIVARAN